MKTISIEIKNFKDVSKKDLETVNKQRIKEYGKGSSLINKKDDFQSAFFLVKDNSVLKAFGALKPITIQYMGREYNVLAMGRGIALEKGKGYGRLLSSARIDYVQKKGKTALAFTSRKNLGFFEKTGFKTSKNFIRRFRYIDPKTGKELIDNEGDGVYYEGKDKLISKMLSTKGIAYIGVPFW